MFPRTLPLLALVALCACATASSSERSGGGTTAAKLKALAPKSTDSALVVIYRNHSFGSMFGPIPYKGSLYVNEVPVGDIGDDTYATVELRPGRHSLRVLGTAAGTPFQSATVVALAGGKVEFVELTSEQGFNRAEIGLKRNPAPELEEIANDCRLAFEIDLAAEEAAAKKPAPVNAM